MAKFRKSKLLRLKNGNEVIKFLSSFADGDYEFDETGVEIAVIEELNPSLASYLLENRAQNRPVDSRHVATLAGTMYAGKFITALDPLRTNRYGLPIDFMHRGFALLASGSVLKNVVLYVLQDDRAVDALDTDQKVRNLGNVYRIRGEKPIPNSVTSGAALECNNFSSYRLGTGARDTLLRVYDQLEFMMELYKINARVTGGFLAGAARCARVDPEKAMEFFSVVAMPQMKYDDLEPDKKPREVKLLRKKLEDNIKNKVRGPLRLHTDAAMTIYAYEAWHSGRRSSTMACKTEIVGNRTDKTTGTKVPMKRLKIDDFGLEEYKASPVGDVMKASRELKGETDKVVRAWLKKEKDKKKAEKKAAKDLAKTRKMTEAAQDEAA